MAILISLTLGFLAGAAYTSFRLAHEPAVPGNKAVSQGRGGAPMPDEAGARIKALEKALKENPEQADAWTQLGNLFFDTSQFPRAIEAYKKSLALEPGVPGVLTDLGVMYRRNGQPEKAVDAFDRAIKADPDFETAFFNKGIVLMHDMNDPGAGVRAWEDLLGINPMAMAPNGEPVKDLIARIRTKTKENPGTE